MFLHLSVTLSMGEGVSGGQRPGQTPPLGRHSPWTDTARADTPLADPPWADQPGKHLPADGYCSGRCASHWNAFLFKSTFAWTFNSSTFVKFHPIKLAVFFHPHELDLEFNPGTGIIGLTEPHTIEVVGVSRFRISLKVYKFNKNFPS